MELFNGLHGICFKNILIFDYTEFANKPMSFSSDFDKSCSAENIARPLPSELSRRAERHFTIPM